MTNTLAHATAQWPEEPRPLMDSRRGAPAPTSRDRISSKSLPPNELRISFSTSSA